MLEEETRQAETLHRLLLRAAVHHDRRELFLCWEEDRSAWVGLPDWKADRDSIRIALFLGERVGVAPGDTVALWMPLSPLWPIIERGAWMLGALTLVLPVYGNDRPDGSVEHVAELLERHRPKVLLAPDERALQRLSRMEALPPCLRTSIVLAGTGSGLAGNVGYAEALHHGGILDTAERASALRSHARSISPEAPATLAPSREGPSFELEILSHGELSRRVSAVLQSSPSPSGDLLWIDTERPELTKRVAMYAAWAEGRTRVVFLPSRMSKEHLERAKKALLAAREEEPKVRGRAGGGWLRRLLGQEPTLAPTEQRPLKKAAFAAVAAGLEHLADLSWASFQAFNTRLPAGRGPHPPWAPRPLLKSNERSRPPLGWPRPTDSLCPECVKALRREVVRGGREVSEILGNGAGQIRAAIVEEDGRLWIRKRCERHGEIEDLLSIDPRFTALMESRFHGRDFMTAEDAHLHRHGSSSIRWGRGSVLTVDLTNRCNMMCNPCFVDANQVGYVHELGLDDIKTILDGSVSFKPRRQLSVQFSGGEPTLSPHFMEACRYAKDLGYWSVQAASNGVRFALEPEFAFQAKEAGLNMVYLQLDGVGNEANRHRHVANLFDVKLRAIENLFQAGVDITPVMTVVNTVNDDQVGPVMELVIEHSDKIGALSYQPVSFTGRDEDISDANRRRFRYTVSHLAHALARHFEDKIDVYRDWHPLGSIGALSWLADHLRGERAAFGGLNCSCHPDCGASLILVVNWQTKAWTPLTAFFDLERFLRDAQVIADTARGPTSSRAQVVMALIRNLDHRRMPAGLTLRKFLRLLNRKMGGLFESEVLEDEWNIVWVGGMWFQDLWTYDFRRTEMCVIPYGTEEGEISFCAYNTGMGWRQIVERLHRTSDTRTWHRTYGRHGIYAGGRSIALPSKSTET